MKYIGPFFVNQTFSIYFEVSYILYIYREHTINIYFYKNYEYPLYNL